MRVAVLCEYSGTVRDAFIKRGHDATSYDLLPSESDLGPHRQGNMFNHWLEISTADLVIAHPPCTYLANSGVRWLHEKPGRWEQMQEGAEFFRDILNLPVPRIAVENPVMHKYAVKIIGQRHDQTIQPWQFGDDASKRTCLWLKGLPPLLATTILRKKRYANQTPSGQNKLGPSPTRAKERAKTYQGIADAMAAQWG